MASQLFVRSLGTYGWPGVEIHPARKGGVWDWSKVGVVRIAVSNGCDLGNELS